MTPHPMAWPDIIIGVLIAEGLLYSLRTILQYLARRGRNQMVAQRLNDMRPAALDSYRFRQEHDRHAPQG
jgi:hypothetical protein